MRKEFAIQLHKLISENVNVFFITGDLGYGLFDEVRKDFPARFINTGAAEQTMMGLAVGLALSGKVAVVYSITPFLLFRPFETIRNYISHESIPVIMVGSGRDDDYRHDGFSHWAWDDEILKQLPNIVFIKEDSFNLAEIVKSGNPTYLNLKR